MKLHNIDRNFNNVVRNFKNVEQTSKRCKTFERFFD